MKSTKEIKPYPIVSTKDLCSFGIPWQSVCSTNINAYTGEPEESGKECYNRKKGYIGRCINNKCTRDFLTLKESIYTNKDGDNLPYGYVVRPKPETKNVKKKADVVTMACQDNDGRFLIIRQPRVPMSGKVVWGFPGGMTDADTEEKAIIKELEEETGYLPIKESVKIISPPLSKSAGLTNETTVLGECKLKKAGEPKPERTELIGYELMTPEEILKLGDRKDEYVSSGLWSYIQGYMKGKKSRKKFLGLF